MSETNPIYDLLIIGGGINGCGIAADAAGRGLSVFLTEKDDLAQHTSSASSKMIHGGLRYLEYYEFRLVREALAERDVLLSVAPHLVQPLQLIIPEVNTTRPAWFVRLGLWLYDHLGFHFKQKSSLPHSHSVKLNHSNDFGKPLKTNLSQGFSYYDCKVDDARLVIANAQSAQHHGAEINVHTTFLSAKRCDGIWQARLQNQQGEFTVKAKALINAAGPWVDRIVQQNLQLTTKHHIELVKGSHIVIPKFYQGDHAYLLQHTDKRVIFVIPYHENFTMIGTTDIPFHGDPNHVMIDQDERDYLCGIVNQYFGHQISPSDIVNEWSGVRPLQADDANNPSAVTRDYTLEIDDLDGKAPLLSIFGGKITTYRRLAEHAMQKLHSYFPGMGPAWTATTPLVGGDISPNKITDLVENLAKKYPFIPQKLLNRWVSSYGSRTIDIIGDSSIIDDFGHIFTADLYKIEVDYLLQNEWAQSADDILWRRSKLGLLASTNEQLQLQAYLDNPQQ